MQVYVEGKYTMFPNDKHWPDANSTLRITYGQLEGSAPTDGMRYTEHTTLDGIIAILPCCHACWNYTQQKIMVRMHKGKNYGCVLLDPITPLEEILDRLFWIKMGI